MGPNFISPELVKIIACVGRKTNEFKQEVEIRTTQIRQKKHGAQSGFLGPLGLRQHYQYN